jgi:aspartyl-tRNA synthetase
LKRTHTCGDLNEKHIGKEAVLNGWVHRRRDHGGLIFIDVRDRYGLTQVVFNPEAGNKAAEKAQSLGKEFVVAVRGRVRKRPEGTENLKISTGKIELVADRLDIINEAKQPLPIEISSHLIAGEDTRLKYRYLDLRRAEMHNNIALRYRLTKAIRDYLDSASFLEIETPILGKSTPEGARDYLVPSRVQKGSFFALPQSPQLFKQVLMVSGYERYFQIARCFRDEDLRADRQPEFTQLDLEMSFVDEEDIYSVVEGCMKRVFSEVLGTEIDTPFPRLSYREAMDRYGSDKPDIRFGLELADVSKVFKDTPFSVFRGVLEKGGVIKALVVPASAGTIGRKEINRLTETAKVYGAKGLVAAAVSKGSIESMIAKHLKEDEIKGLLSAAKAKEGDTLLIVADGWQKCCTVLGQVRLSIAQLLSLIPQDVNKFLWVSDFPMFEWDDDEGRLKSMHHPFTSPKEEDLEFLESEPLKVRSRGYDIVFNGVELGGGSIRIHKRAIQKRIFRLLGIPDKEAEEKFGFLLEAFSYGAPPHGGIALGLDRFAMLLCNTDSIREVIAFPKNKACLSLMDGAPSGVPEKQLKELGLKHEEEE